MCDLVPGYVTTLCNPYFDKIQEDLIVVGLEDGKIKTICTNKEALFAKLAMRKKRSHLVCYYRNLVFTPAEERLIFHYDVRLVDEAAKKRVVAAWAGAMSIVMR